MTDRSFDRESQDDQCKNDKFLLLGNQSTKCPEREKATQPKADCPEDLVCYKHANSKKPQSLEQARRLLPMKPWFKGSRGEGGQQERAAAPYLQAITNLEKLIFSVNNLYQHQQSEEYQFGIIFITSDKSFESTKFRTKDIPSAQDPSLYSITFPPLGYSSNYISACPKQSATDELHAEILLLCRLEELLSSYDSQGPDNSSHTVVFYSWQLPCLQCKDRIVETIATTAGRAVILAYTRSDNYTATDSFMELVEVQRVVDEFEQAGIEVVKVEAKGEHEEMPS